jgi:hypothetical protein
MFQILKIFHKNGYIFIGTGNLGYFPFIPSSNIVKKRLLYLRSPKGDGDILFYLCPSFRQSKIFFVAFFSVTVVGRNLIFGHKLHIGMPYCGKRFWTHIWYGLTFLVRCHSGLCRNSKVFVVTNVLCEQVVPSHYILKNKI